MYEVGEVVRNGMMNEWDENGMEKIKGKLIITQPRNKMKE